MPGTNSNTVLYATRAARYPEITLASGAAATDTEVVAGASTYGSVVTDIIISSADATARNFEIKIGPSGGAGSITRRVVIVVPIGAGNGGSGTPAPASLAALAPQLFSIDLAGNRTIGLESGVSIYMKNTSTTAGQITISPIARDYAP